MNYNRNLEYDLDLYGGPDGQKCDGETKGFMWFHLLMVTELMIFSVRAPGFFIKSMPSIWLILSVFLTLVLGALLATLLNRFGLHGANLGYIIAFNIGSFIIVDLLKIRFREMVGESPGDIIESDDLIEPPARTEVQKQVEKGMREVVQKECVQAPEDRDRVVEVNERGSMRAFFGLNTDLNLNGGFVNQNQGLRTSMAVRPMQGNHRRTKQVSSPY